MGDLFSGMGGGGGNGDFGGETSGSADASGGGFGGFLRGMGTGFVNGRLGPNNSFTGTPNDPLSKLFSSTINNIGAQGNATQPNSPVSNSPLLQPGVVPAPGVSQFGHPVSSAPNAQWGTDEWGTPQG